MKMKKQLLATAVAVLAIGVFAGCGKKGNVPTVQEIYDANMKLSEDLKNSDVEADFSMDLSVSATSPAISMLLGGSGDSISASANMSGEMANEVAHLEGTYSIDLAGENESGDMEVWTDSDYTYTYMSMTDAWTKAAADTSVADLTDELSSSDTQSSILKMQSDIDDAKNTDATLTKEGNEFVLNYNLPLSDLADYDELTEYTSEVGMDASSLKALKGKVLLSMTFDTNTLYVKSLHISLDDNAKKEIEDALSAFAQVTIDELRIDMTLDYKKGTLEIPADVQEGASDGDFGLDGFLGGDSTLDGDSLMVQAFEVDIDRESFMSAFTVDGTISLATAEGNWDISAERVIEDMYFYLVTYSSLDDVYDAITSYISISEDVDCVEHIMAAASVMGMFSDSDANAENLIGELYAYADEQCVIIDMNAVGDAMTELALMLQ